MLNAKNKLKRKIKITNKEIVEVKHPPSIFYTCMSDDGNITRIEYFRKHFYGWENLHLRMYQEEAYPSDLDSMLLSDHGELTGFDNKNSRIIRISWWLEKT